MDLCLIWECIQDLYKYGWIDNDEYEDFVYWLTRFEMDGTMPGARKFRSVYSNELVTFPWYIEELRLMHWLALADFCYFEEYERMTEDEYIQYLMLEEIGPVFPENIGRFNLVSN